MYTFHLNTVVAATDETIAADAPVKTPEQQRNEALRTIATRISGEGSRNQDGPRPGQLVRFLDMLETEKGQEFIARLSEKDGQLETVAHGEYRGDIGKEFTAWCEELGAGTATFPRNHIWLRGFVSTYLAVQELDQAHQDLDTDAS